MGDKKCGAERSIEPDGYKFSIFGAVQGDEYDTKVQAGVDGFPAGMDKMGVRIQLEAYGFDVTNLIVNGKSWDVSMVNEDVNSMFIMDDSGVGINYEFPKKYNTGITTDAEEDEELPNTGTHDMAIRISTIDEDKQTIMIDYLFDTSKLTAGTWFIYDPDVTAVPVPSAVPSSNPTISAAPSAVPSAIPSSIPSSVPSSNPTDSTAPSSNPSLSAAPSSMPIDSKSSATTTVKGSFLLLTSAVAIMNLAN